MNSFYSRFLLTFGKRLLREKNREIFNCFCRTDRAPCELISLYSDNHERFLSLAPPSYEECMQRADSIKDDDESSYVHGANEPFAPRYPVFNFQPPRKSLMFRIDYLNTTHILAFSMSYSTDSFGKWMKNGTYHKVELTSSYRSSYFDMFANNGRKEQAFSKSQECERWLLLPHNVRLLFNFILRIS